MFNSSTYVILSFWTWTAKWQIFYKNKPYCRCFPKSQQPWPFLLYLISVCASRLTPLRRLAVKRRMFSLCKQTLKRIRFRCILLTAMAQNHRRSSTNVICKRLGVVIGHEEKENQMIVCYSLDTPPTQHVVYIGGDVQVIL